jgi:Pal1 cell morphology protein
VKIVWHHDGPFDACRPHRNSKKNALAPINAFPMGSANNTIGGSGPVNPGINLEQFHGVGKEGFHDYGNVASMAPSEPTAKPFRAMATSVVNPINRVEPVHGEETMGLGTSTFLEGAPASRQAIQRTQSEQSADGGIMRKKSIAMRLRGMSQSRRYPDGYPGSGAAPPGSPPTPLRSPSGSKGRFQDRSGGVTLSDGSPLGSPEPPRPGTASRTTEINPFEKLDEVDEKKAEEASVSVAETTADGTTTTGTRERGLSSPRRSNGLERRATDTDETGNPKPSGFLSRVKSLKGNRKKGDRPAS